MVSCCTNPLCQLVVSRSFVFVAIALLAHQRSERARARSLLRQLGKRHPPSASFPLVAINSALTASLIYNPTSHYIQYTMVAGGPTIKGLSQFKEVVSRGNAGEPWPCPSRCAPSPDYGRGQPRAQLGLD